MNLKKLVTFLFVAAFAFSGNIVRAHDGDEGEAVHEETLDSIDGEAAPEDGAEEKAVHKAEKKEHKQKHAKKSAKKKVAKKKHKKKSHS